MSLRVRESCRHVSEVHIPALTISVVAVAHSRTHNRGAPYGGTPLLRAVTASVRWPCGGAWVRGRFDQVHAFSGDGHGGCIGVGALTPIRSLAAAIGDDGAPGALAGCEVGLPKDLAALVVGDAGFAFTSDGSHCDVDLCVAVFVSDPVRGVE